MVIAGLMLGFLLGVAFAAVLWATGRRPYLRVDIEQHCTTTVVHHVLDPTDPAARPTPAVAGRVVDGPPVSEVARGYGHLARTRREISS